MAAYKKMRNPADKKLYAVPTSVAEGGKDAINAWFAETNPQSIEEAQAASESYKTAAPGDPTQYMGTRPGFEGGDILQTAMPLASYGAKRDFSPATVGAMGAIDAATWLVPPVAAARLAPMAVQGIKASAVPLSNLLAKLARPAIEGGVGAAMVAPQEYAQTGEIGMGTALSGLAPAIGKGGEFAVSKAAQGAKNIGTGIMESVVKAPKGKQTVKGYTPELAFEQGVLAARPTAYGGVEKTLENVEKRISDLNDQYSTVLKEAGKDAGGAVTKVDMQTPMQRAAQEVQEGIADGNYGDIADDLGKAVERWSNAVEQVSKDGTFTAEQVVNFRKRLGSVAQFGKNVPERDQQADAIFAKLLYEKMNDAVSEVFPEVRALDAEMTKLIPLRKVYEPAEARLRSNQGISLADMAALGAGGIGGTAMGQSIPLALGGLAVRRASVSPAVAAGLYGAGKAIDPLAQFAGTPLSALARGTSSAFYPTPTGEQ